MLIRTEEDLRAIIEYIMNNPVRKGIVEKIDDYPYSESFDVEIQKICLIVASAFAADNSSSPPMIQTKFYESSSDRSAP